MLTEAGYEGYTRAVTPGGYRFDQHAADADGTNGNTTLRQLLVTGEDGLHGWDVVLLQQQSQVGGFPTTDPMWAAMEQGATTLRDLATAASADTVVWITWGRRDGDSMNPGMYPDFTTMQDRLTEGFNELARRLATTGKPVFITPVGEGFRAIHTAGDMNVFNGLYSGDGSHPSMAGSYLTACVLFATITAKTPVGLAYVPNGLSDGQKQALQQVAADLVLGESAPADWVRRAGE